MERLEEIVRRFKDVGIRNFTMFEENEDFFEERASRAVLGRFREILEKAGDTPPQPGDEIPEELRDELLRDSETVQED